MSARFMSSDEYHELAHRLYNEGRYDDALGLLKEGTGLYPHATELHVGMSYAYLVREEYAWARQSFRRSLALDPDHEDALAGHGEVLLQLGQRTDALEHFERVLELGFRDDHDLMLQIGRALFRDGLVAQALRYFEYGVTAHPDSADASACVGYVSHRLGREGAAFFWLRRALALESHHAEARIYLANLLYDRGESDAALHHFEQTVPDDHYDELSLWRTIDLKKTCRRLTDDDPSLRPWLEHLADVAGEREDVDILLAELESQQPDGSIRNPHQLELFGALVTDPQSMLRRGSPGDSHIVATLAGHLFKGTWDEILVQMKSSDGDLAAASMGEFMASVARRGRAETGVVIPLTDAEAFIRGSARAGVLRIIR
ncbi:MAG: tetratricopeptide repeat protein [Gemmatimonadales bacterium]|nr:MAG: tetratricopeptide repeat protein [Gemmatimonadales bacterium]